jgi:hypothetical protein
VSTAPGCGLRVARPCPVLRRRATNRSLKGGDSVGAVIAGLPWPEAPGKCRAHRRGSLRPLAPSNLLVASLAGETGSARIAVITWDASLHGWGMVLRWWANITSKVVVGTLPDSGEMRHQARREPLTGVLAPEQAQLDSNVAGEPATFARGFRALLVPDSDCTACRAVRPRGQIPRPLPRGLARRSGRAGAHLQELLAVGPA